MQLLFDSDAFVKLGVCGLLDEATRLLGVDLRQCGRLPALPHMLRRGRLRRVYGAEACDELIPIAKAMPDLPPTGDTWLEKLRPVDAIDPGEAQIFAAAAQEGLTVVSGDKRALRALKDLTEFVDPLSGRVVVFEALLLALCDRYGYRKIQRRVTRLAESDTMVRICFPTTNTDPVEALISYYRDIVSELDPLVLWDPRGGTTR